TGAVLLFNIANQTVINLGAAPRDVVSTSTMSLDFLQPLLRGAGRAVTLEPLTLAERELLYAIRIFARFRKEFFVSLAGGGGGCISGGSFVPSGVVSISTVSPTAGFGSSGITPGIPQGIPIVGARLFVTPGPSGQLNLTPAIPPSPAGYLGTLLEYAQ